MMYYGLQRWRRVLCFVGCIIMYIIYRITIIDTTTGTTKHYQNPIDRFDTSNHKLLSHLESRRGTGKWGTVLTDMNKPLRNYLHKPNSLETIDISALGLDSNLDESGRYTKNGAKSVISKHILSEDAFKSKENVAKLLALAYFIKEEDYVSLDLNVLRSSLVPQNFDGQRFLLQNSKDLAGRLDVLASMMKIVNLTQSELLVLQTATPGTGTSKRKWRKFESLNMYKKKSGAPLKNWEVFHNQIDQYGVYKSNEVIEKVMHDLRTQKIIKMTTRDDGTQIKLVLRFEDGSRALFKPQRIPKTQETLPNAFYFNEYERHTAEIAAFNLDRALELRHTPPVVGRILSISEDIIPLVDDEFKTTFFDSNSGNTCFYGACDYYCDMDHAICGSPDNVDGSVAAYLPSNKVVERGEWQNPWRRSYSRTKKAKWEYNPDYCKTAKNMPPHGDERRMLDVMDMTIFDFFQGNLDRHHYETFTKYDNDTSPIYLDNGRGWGRAFYDEMSILTPIKQCCMIRYSTLKKLLNFDQGPVKLSDVMRDLLASDILKPVLLEEQLLALDRRIKIVLKVVHKCIEKTGGASKVIFDL